MKRVLFILAIASMLSGCYKVRVHSLSAQGSPGHSDQYTAHTVLFGLITLNEIDARQACGDANVWAVQTKYNGISFIVSALTGALYFPMYAEVTCATK